MTRKLTLLGFLAFLTLQMNAQEGWFNQKISDKVSVTFPVQPKKLTDVAMGITDKDGVIYFVTHLNLAEMLKVQPEEFSTAILEQTYADEFLSGLAPSMPSYSFKGVKIIKIKGNTTYQLEGRDDLKKATIFMNVVFLNGHSYGLSCVLKDGLPVKNKDIFLTNIFIEN